MNINNLKTTYNINSSCPPCRTVVSHDCDVNTRTVEVCFYQGMIPLVISKDCTAKAIFVERETNILINDNVPCTVTEAGSVLIPVDNLHRQGRFDMSIELTVTNQEGEKVLVTPFPMWITVNGSILNEAEVTEESKGTVPELLEAAEQALSEAKDYEKLDNLPAINGHELVGNKSSDDLGLQDKLTAGENITINANGEISATGGTDDYENLRNRPIIKTFNDYRQSVLSGVIKLPDGFGMDLSEEGIIKLYLGYISGSKIEGGTVGYDKLDNQFANSLVRAGITDLHTDLNNAYYNSIVYISNPTGKINLPVRRAGFAITLTSRDLSQNFLFHVLQIYVTKSSYEEPKVFVRTARNNTGSVLSGGDFSPWTELTRYISSAVVNSNGTITVTMSDGSTVTTTGESVIGPQGPAGADGNDYVLTAQDKSDIAAIVLSELPTTQGVLYGNTSN